MKGHSAIFSFVWKLFFSEEIYFVEHATISGKKQVPWYREKETDKIGKDKEMERKKVKHKCKERKGNKDNNKTYKETDK